MGVQVVEGRHECTDMGGILHEAWRFPERIPVRVLAPEARKLSANLGGRRVKFTAGSP
jgi:hypothetical protein